ncbi:MAG: hypothetical protein EP321_02050 [Sphingomonadales bacterium]|nr:MAG: hypothetical protein EP321_02050 [Sphingomonadales bacterium]
MTKIISSQPRVLQVRGHDLDLARRRNPKCDAEVIEAAATAFAAIRNLHMLCGPGTAAASAVASMLPVQMRRKLGRELLKAA